MQLGVVCLKPLAIKLEAPFDPCLLRDPRDTTLRSSQDLQASLRVLHSLRLFDELSQHRGHPFELGALGLRRRPHLAIGGALLEPADEGDLWTQLLVVFTGFGHQGGQFIFLEAQPLEPHPAISVATVDELLDE